MKEKQYEIIEIEKERIKIFIKNIINQLEYRTTEDTIHNITDFAEDREQAINYLKRLSIFIDNFEKD